MAIIVDCATFLQSPIYLLICVCGGFVSIPMIVNRYHFDGDCILFAFTDAQTGVKSPKRYVVAGASGNCDFIIYYSILGFIIYGLVMSICYMYVACKSKQFIPNKWLLPFLVTDSVIGFTSIVAALIFTLGYVSFCNSLMKNIPADHTKNCSYYEYKDWTSRTTGWKYNVKDYTTLMDMALVGLWVGFGLQLIQVLFDVYRYFRNRRTS